MNPQFTRDIIFNYLNGRATVVQKKQIDEWIKLQGNEELFFKYLDEWEEAHLQFQSDTDHAINQYRSFLNGFDKRENQQLLAHPSASQTEHPSSGKRLFWYISAAVLLLISSLAGDTVLYRQYRTKPGEIATWTLGDGSKVTLNSNSVIKFRENWLNEKNRTVYLTGEAEFSVSHLLDHRKFIVRTGNNLDIVVKGTIFTVFSRNAHTEVILNEGAVELQHLQGIIERKINMQPGEKVVLGKNGQLEKEILAEKEDFAAWKEHRFVFDNTPLSEIIKILRDNYQIKAEIANDDLASLTVSGSFKAENYTELIASVSEILDIQYEIRKNKTVVFTKRSEH